jgi:CheY-like chemotaxis protein
MANLSGLNILVVEDEFFVAYDIASALTASGAEVIGPAGSLEQATTLFHETTPVHGAILDVNVLGKMIFPLADELAERGVPFVFTTGYDRETIPERHRGVTRIEKPALPEKVMNALASAASKPQG